MSEVKAKKWGSKVDVTTSKPSAKNPSILVEGNTEQDEEDDHIEDLTEGEIPN